MENILLERLATIQREVERMALLVNKLQKTIAGEGRGSQAKEYDELKGRILEQSVEIGLLIDETLNESERRKPDSATVIDAFNR